MSFKKTHMTRVEHPHQEKKLACLYIPYMQKRTSKSKDPGLKFVPLEHKLTSH